MTTTWNNQLKTLALLGALSALLVGVGGALAPGQMSVFLVLALGMNVGAYWFSDRLVLRMHGARELAPHEAIELHGVIRTLAERAEIPMPRVFLVDDPQPNAFATGRSPARGAVAVTSGLLTTLSPSELRGVLAHELAHIKNRDTLVATIAAAVATAITYAAHALSFSTMFGGRRDGEEDSGPSAFLVAMVAPVAATILQLAVSRSREYLADAEGARIAGDPTALANALLRLERSSMRAPAEGPAPATASLYIVNPFMSAEGLSRLFATHPATADRVARLMAMAGRRAF